MVMEKKIKPVFINDPLYILANSFHDFFPEIKIEILFKDLIIPEEENDTIHSSIYCDFTNTYVISLSTLLSIDEARKELMERLKEIIHQLYYSEPKEGIK